VPFVHIDELVPRTDAEPVPAGNTELAEPVAPDAPEEVINDPVASPEAVVELL
jgi:hypothetical protein